MPDLHTFNPLCCRLSGALFDTKHNEVGAHSVSLWAAPIYGRATPHRGYHLMDLGWML
jgi:hypothetical protein